MKSMKFWIGLFFLSLMAFTFFTSCEDDDPEIDKDEIVATWNIKSFNTNNATLDISLNVLLAAQGIEVTDGTFTFENDGIAHISIPQSGKSSIEYSAAYEYTGSQLAFRFDEIIPIPFNTDVIKLTASEFAMQITVPPAALNLLIELVELENPELGPTLKALLEPNMEKGLLVTIQLRK